MRQVPNADITLHYSALVAETLASAIAYALFPTCSRSKRMKMLAVAVAVYIKLLNRQSKVVLTKTRYLSKQSGKNNLQKSKLLLMADFLLAW